MNISLFFPFCDYISSAQFYLCIYHGGAFRRRAPYFRESVGKWYTVKGPGDNLAVSYGRAAQQSWRGPLTNKVRWEQRWKEEGHMWRGVALVCSIFCALFRMGILPKLIEWGENVWEREAMATTAGSFNSLRNLAPLSANRVNETCNLISSGGRKQTLMVNVIYGLSYGKWFPTNLTVNKWEQLFFTINIGIRLCQAMVQSTA